jgi:glutaminase-like protein
MASPMANPNAIISTTIRLDPPLEGAATELVQREGGVSVELDGRRAQLDPRDPRSPGFAQVLDGLSTLRMPVYVEIDPATDAITRVLVPLVSRVSRVESAKDVLDVELDTSHARHVLRLGGPGSEDLERRLREAVKDAQPVILVEDDAHNIIDIREFRPDPARPLPPFPPVPFPRHKPLWLLRWLHWIWWWTCWPWWWWRCPSAVKAQQVFDAMAATTCNPLTVPPPCIPFLYPDDGCWARAHEMCRLMIALGVSPSKVWIDHSAGYWLHVNTKNNPQCYVEWGWHVAPTLCVRGPRFFSTQRMVLDPALFTTPVSKPTWKGVQGDPAATLTDTGPEQFWHGGGTDPAYVSSNAILAQYRLALQNRSNQVGPPPYANCP